MSALSVIMDLYHDWYLKDSKFCFTVSYFSFALQCNQCGCKEIWVETMQTSFTFLKWFPGDYANEITKGTPHGPSLTLLEAATW